MTLLVTGATGMLGQAVMAEAEARGLSPIGLARKNSDISADITDDQALTKVFETHGPGAVVNCAAMINIDRCEEDPLGAWRVNARAVDVLATLCRNHATRLVQISTDHYFTGAGNARHDENAPVTLLNEYSRVKFAAEAFALNNPDNLVARINIVGLRGWDTPTFAEWAIDLIKNDREGTLFEDSFVSSIDTPTCARALLDLMQTGAAGVFNVASREVFSKKTFVLVLAKVLGRELTNVKTGSVAALQTGRAESLGLNVAKAEKALGYALPTLNEVVDSLAGEFKEVA